MSRQSHSRWSHPEHPDDLFSPESSSHPSPYYDPPAYSPMAINRDSYREVVAQAMISSYPEVVSQAMIPCPVVIPQRRPGTKERGFAYAYAPCLEGCGIDEVTFLDFVEDCNKAIKGSPFLMAVQIAAFGVSFTPELITMGVATAISIGATVTNGLWVNHKVNRFLERMNEQLFRPRGLYCMIMMFAPGPAPYDSNKNPSALARGASSSGAGPLDLLRKGAEHVRILRSLSTAPFNKDNHGPPAQVAPLVYVDRKQPPSAEPDRREGERLQEKAKRAMKKLDAYLDKRAQARYAAENRESALAAIQRPHEGFRHRYLDPTHPATNSGLLGLVTGGVLAPDPYRSRQRKLEDLETREWQEREQYRQALVNLDRQSLSNENDRLNQLRNIENQFEPRLADIRKQRDDAEIGFERSITKVLYLTVVKMPTEEELAVARRRLQLGGGSVVSI